LTAGFHGIPRHLVFTKCGKRHTPRLRGVNISRLPTLVLQVFRAPGMTSPSFATPLARLLGMSGRDPAWTQP
jgi:hypothetical protein